MRPLFLASTEALLPIEEVVAERVLLVGAATVAAVALVTSNVTVLAGIAAIAAGTWAVRAYRANVIEKEFRLSIDGGWNAAIAGLRDNGESVVGRARLSPTEGSLESRRARLDVLKLRGGLVRLRVRVGWFPTAESRRVAELILESAERWIREGK